MQTKKELHGLYVITDACAGQGESLIRHAEAALRGGARILQYRDKSSDTTRRRLEAQQLAELCRNYQVRFIINDDVALAKQVKADGVHLGREDNNYETARSELGPDAIIGISCYNQLERAQQAEARGADYVAFGRFFPSSTKPQATQAQTEILTEAKSILNIPIVAIGGITPDNGGNLLEYGADALAVIAGVFASDNIETAARDYASLFADSN